MTIKDNLSRLAKKPLIWILTGILLASSLLMLWTLSPPKIKSGDQNFSAENVYRHVQKIDSFGPHSVFEQDALEKVRSYILTTAAGYLQPLGQPITRVKHTNVLVNDVGTVPVTEAVEVPVENLYATIEGKSNSYILLMAHYDSAPHRYRDGVYIGKSNGAADDGYGVAALLEIIRVVSKQVSEGEPPENGIKFLFTDAEEPWPNDESLVGLFGANAAINEYSKWLDGVNLVINVEARGVKGPLFMFQTSEGNKALIRLLRKANRPFSFSVASDVYRILPSDTDLSPFLEAGYAALNFSTLNSLENNHTPEDNINNVDKKTLQAYGNQILPIVQEYMSDAVYSDADYFISDRDMVFFTLLPFIFISYTDLISWFIIVAFIAGFAVVMYFVSNNRLICLKKSLLALALLFAFMLAAAIDGLILSFIISRLSGLPFNFMNTSPPFALGYLILFTIGLIVAAYFLLKLFKRLNISLLDAFCGCIYLLSALLILSALFLHGATYLFLFPAILMTGYLGVYTMPTENVWAARTRRILIGFALFVIVLFYGYLVYSVYLALSFGALAAHMLFAALGGLLLIICGSCFLSDKQQAVNENCPLDDKRQAINEEV